MPADYLSRAPCMSDLPHTINFIGEDLKQEVAIHQVFCDLPITQLMVTRGTQNDFVLLKLITYCRFGWPTYDAVPQELRPYYANRINLGVSQGIITWGVRVILPTKLRAKYLNELHRSHQGIVKTKALARGHVWWPGLGSDIENLVASCTECASHNVMPALTQISPLPLPRDPWSRLHVDLAEFKGIDFLVLVDSHTKWIEVKILRSTTSQAVLNKLNSIFFCFWVSGHLGQRQRTPISSGNFFIVLHQPRNSTLHVLTIPPPQQRDGGARGRHFLIFFEERYYC